MIPVCHVFMEDIKISYSLNYVNREIEFAISIAVHRLPRVLHHVCLQPQSYYTFLAFTASQPIQSGVGLPPPPPSPPPPK